MRSGFVFPACVSATKLFKHSMPYLLKMTKCPSQYKKPHSEYKLYTNTKKRTFKIDTKFFFH